MTASKLPLFETAVHHFVESVALAQASENVGSVIARLTGNAFDSVEFVIKFCRVSFGE